MQFRLLGPVEIKAAGEVPPIRRRRERCLLAVLLLDPNRVIPIDRLTELLWDGSPPDHGTRLLHSHVSNLRRVIAAAAGPGGVTITTVGRGYRIDVDPQSVDLHRFRALCDQAAASDVADRIDRLHTALGLWRGPALEDAASDWLRDRLCVDLEEQRLAAVEDLFSASLALRREREVLPELAQAAAAHPGRESLTALHLQALYQADRKRDALEVYERARAHLADELGLDPGPRLRELHRAILRDELEVPPPVAARSAPARPATEAPARPGPAPVVPAQLPADLVGFTGRTAHLDRLDSLLSGTGAATAPVVIVIGGAAGVGKTALGVHWAHRVRDWFPDGQLYVDLRGFSPEPPVRPAEVLAGFLPALGLPGREVPVSVDEASATCRSLLAGRRMLVFLDNAAGVDQVRPLLPGAAGCLVVVTSRDQLGGLVARHGAHWLHLDVLPPAEAVALLERALGTGRASAEPDAVAELAQLCGHLPLALRIAAANLTVRPALRVADQVARLRQRDRLAALAVDGDPGHAVAAAFDLSYQRLPAPARRLFRLLGLVPGPDITAEAAAALAGVAPAAAGAQLSTLVRAQLLSEPVAGRFTCHDLLRAYAADRAAREEPDPDQARGRLLCWYRDTAGAASSVLHPQAVRLPAGPPAATGGTRRSFEGRAEAMTWLQAERATLLSAITHTAERGPRPVAWQLAHCLRGFWWEAGHLVDGLTAATAAQAAAQAEDDQLGQAVAELCLGHVRGFQGHHAEAAVHFHRTVEMARSAGWPDGLLAALSNGALSDARLGRFERAVAGLTEALALDRTSDRLVGQVVNLNTLGGVYQDMGQLPRAAGCFAEAVALSQQGGLPPNVWTIFLCNLGSAVRDLGRLAEAHEHLGQALAQCQELGHRPGEALALEALAGLHRDAGDYAQAAEAALAAAALASEIGDRHTEATARNTLGAAHCRLGCPQQALAEHRQALDLARQEAALPYQIDALRGLAAAYHALDDRSQAHGLATQALSLARERGYRDREGQALTLLAEFHHHQHDHQTALGYAGRALASHRQTAHRLGEARTLLLLGHLHHQAGDQDTARAYWQQAYTLFTAIGTTEADLVAPLLAGDQAASGTS